MTKNHCFDKIGEPVEVVSSDSDEPRTDETVLPLFFKGIPKKAVTDFVTGYNVIGIIDATLEEGIKALVAVEQGIPYTGFGFNDQHVSVVMDNLDLMIYASFKEEGNKLYKPELSKLVKGTGGVVDKKRKATTSPANSSSSSDSDSNS